jgi:glycogen synthase
MSSVLKISFRANSSNLLQQNYVTKTSVEKNKITPKENTELKTAKTVSYVSAGIALASLGLGIAAVKKGKSFDEKAFLGKIKAEFKNGITTATESLGEQFEIKIGEVATKTKKNLAATTKLLDDKITGLGKWQDGQIAAVKTETNEKIAKVVGDRVSGKLQFFSRAVAVNGQEFKLADVLNPVGGDANKAFELELRSESARRILGLGPKLPEIPKDAMIRIPTSEISGFSSTGGLAIVPKEIADNLAALLSSKQKAQIVIDAPLYTGNVSPNTYYRLELNRDTGLYNYLKTAPDKGTVHTKSMSALKLIDEMEIPIHTDTGKTTEKVRIFMAEAENKLDYDLVSKTFDKPFEKLVEESIAKKGFFENDLVKISQKGDEREAFAKVKHVFYDSPKFKIDAPIDTGSNLNIYANNAISAGETERFVYFSKFFYEHLLNGENSKVPLKADLIIGNDWQTGPISAMTRQLTTARKFYGLNPEFSDKIKNTPIVTVMHNAGLSGNVWHSQDKLLNIMFGEHAAKITENCYVPNTNIGGKFGLPGNIHNGLFDNTNFHPQLMAANYSDYIIPVSGPKHYSEEIAMDAGFGGAAQPIFKLRFRAEEFSSLKNLKTIAQQNGLNPDLIKSVDPTMVGITNGSDKMANTLNHSTAGALEKALNLPIGSFRLLKKGEDVLSWHNYNKKAYLDKVIAEIDLARTTKGANNPMKIASPEMTDLTGVDENTPVFATAGRIVDQKGLDIFAGGIKEFYSKYKGTNYPVFYVQGNGDKKYIDSLLAVKQEIAKSNPAAAKRIVFADLFSEPGRYDGTKIMSDFSVMSSWFEPCGLVHKQIGAYSGAVPIVNETGGLTHGYTDGVNAIFSKFVPRHTSASALAENSKNFGDAILKGVALFENKPKFAEAVKQSVDLDFSWLKKNGPIYDYAKLLIKSGIFDPKILPNKN